MLHKGWENFKAGKWQSGIDVRGFIQAHYQPFSDQPVFLSEPSRRTRDLTDKFDRLREIERAQGGVLDIDTSTVSSLLSYEPGYLDRQQEIIVGLQTGRPLKRSVNPFGGIRMAEKACKDYGFSLSDRVHEYFRYRTTHNDGVFRVYTPEMRAARKSGIITGLPDAYGRGRLVGDYRRVALYGTDFLIDAKEQDKLQVSKREMDDESIRLLEEVYRQIDFLKKLRSMASLYGYDISKPARTAREAIQWLYFAYLASIKEQNGAAMSLGRVSTFLDIYIERDIAAGRLSESKAQELIDDFVLKLRMARQLRTSEYNELFAGDPLWITEAIGGMGEDGRTLVSKTSYRMLHTLDTLGAAPEPNLTILWSDSLPEAFKAYCADIAIRTSAVQFENDDLMRPVYGDDYAIACCVSAGRVGYDMQFFGARCNLPKVLLMALNGGRDELSGDQIGPVQSPVRQGKLDYNDIKKRFDVYQSWLCRLYVRTMNVIHAMHDKYAYEKTQMALHETDVNRFMAFGLAGLSVTADAFSAIKHAEVYPVFDKRGLVTDFNIKGPFPCYGNDDDRADQIAKSLCENFYQELSKTPCYRNASHTLSILTITSNVVYGLKTGATPDGRKKGDPFAPGANPMHGRDRQGVLASLNSVAKIPYEACRDGISNTLTLAPSALGRQKTEQLETLKALLGGYFQQSGHHLNINVLNRSQLEDAMEHPEKYPNLTIRVSGYAVQFTRLSREQQQEILKRTWHS